VPRAVPRAAEKIRGRRFASAQRTFTSRVRPLCVCVSGEPRGLRRIHQPPPFGTTSPGPWHLKVAGPVKGGAGKRSGGQQGGATHPLAGGRCASNERRESAAADPGECLDGTDGHGRSGEGWLLGGRGFSGGDGPMDGERICEHLRSF
jgi:hypothetical protein